MRLIHMNLRTAVKMYNSDGKMQVVLFAENCFINVKYSLLCTVLSVPWNKTF